MKSWQTPMAGMRPLPAALATLAAVLVLAACAVRPVATGGQLNDTPVAVATQVSDNASAQPAEASTAVTPENGETAAKMTSPADCTAPRAATPAQTEGPYYTPDTPERTSLVEDGMPGTRLTVSGYVLDTNCRPIAGAWLDFWQADANGVYDNSGYTLRGHQFSDATGRYTLETVLPGEYPGRTPHIHVKVQAPGRPVLTTQLYLPNEPGNTRDGIYDPALLVEMQDGPEAKLATFDFVLNLN